MSELLEGRARQHQWPAASGAVPQLWLEAGEARPHSPPRLPPGELPHPLNFTRQGNTPGAHTLLDFWLPLFGFDEMELNTQYSGYYVQNLQFFFVIASSGDNINASTVPC